VDCRKNPVRAKRAERYKAETDALFLKAWENATLTKNGDYYVPQVPAASWDEWTTKKNTIRTELPYPE